MRPPVLDGPAVRGKLRGALEHMDTARAEARAAIYESDDRASVLRRVLAAEEAMQLALNDITETMLLASPSLPPSEPDPT